MTNGSSFDAIDPDPAEDLDAALAVLDTLCAAHHSKSDAVVRVRRGASRREPLTRDHGGEK
jgi:hypothetical protein